MKELPSFERGFDDDIAINYQEPDSSRQGQARNSDLELWSGYDSGIPTCPDYSETFLLFEFVCFRWDGWVEK